jgi:hypothetical protein
MDICRCGMYIRYIRVLPYAQISYESVLHSSTMFIQAAEFLTYIRKISGSNLCHDMYYAHWVFFFSYFFSDLPNKLNDIVEYNMATSLHCLSYWHRSWMNSRRMHGVCLIAQGRFLVNIVISLWVSKKEARLFFSTYATTILWIKLCSANIICALKCSFWNCL